MTTFTAFSRGNTILRSGTLSLSTAPGETIKLTMPQTDAANLKSVVVHHNLSDYWYHKPRFSTNTHSPVVSLVTSKVPYECLVLNLYQHDLTAPILIETLRALLLQLAYRVNEYSLPYPEWTIFYPNLPGDTSIFVGGQLVPVRSVSSEQGTGIIRIGASWPYHVYIPPALDAIVLNCHLKGHVVYKAMEEDRPRPEEQEEWRIVE